MALEYIGSKIGGGATIAGQVALDMTENDSSARFHLGSCVYMWDTTLSCVQEYIYARGVAGVVVTDAMIIKCGDNAGVLLDDDAGAGGEWASLVGFAMAAIVAAEYGWFHICGRATANVLASFADNQLIYATTTAGTVDDAAGGGQLLNARSAGAIGTPDAGSAYIDIHYPSMAGASAGLA